MHIVLMFLQHLVVCKIGEFILHGVWLGIKKTIDLTVTLFVLWLLSPLLKSADRVVTAFGVLLLLIAAGLVSSADFNLAPARQKAV